METQKSTIRQLLENIVLQTEQAIDDILDKIERKFEEFNNRDSKIPSQQSNSETCNCTCGTTCCSCCPCTICQPIRETSTNKLE